MYMVLSVLSTVKYPFLTTREENYRDLFPDEEEMLSMPAPPKGY